LTLVNPSKENFQSLFALLFLTAHVLWEMANEAWRSFVVCSPKSRLFTYRLTHFHLPFFEAMMFPLWTQLPLPNSESGLKLGSMKDPKVAAAVCR